MYGLSHLGSDHLSGGHLGAEAPSQAPIQATQMSPAPINVLHPLLIVAGAALVAFIVCRALDKNRSTGE